MKKDNAEMQPKGYGTNAKVPSGSGSSDKSGERMGRAVNGVAMGKADSVGSNKNFDGGRQSGLCYSHDRKSYQK